MGEEIDLEIFGATFSFFDHVSQKIRDFKLLLIIFLKIGKLVKNLIFEVKFNVFIKFSSSSSTFFTQKP